MLCAQWHSPSFYKSFCEKPHGKEISGESGSAFALLLTFLGNIENWSRKLFPARAEKDQINYMKILLNNSFYEL